MASCIQMFLVGISAAISLNSLIVNNALAFTISDTASGSVSPSTSPVPNTVMNGDFLIGNATTPGALVGDGIDETTFWTFDFTDFLDEIPSPTKLESARFTLTITPKLGITSDLFRISGLSAIITEEIRLSPVNKTKTVSFELLDFYNSDQILGVFTDDVNGQIPFEYIDDAIVSFARLDLTFTKPVPEPATILGSAMAIGFGALLKRGYSKKRQ